MTLIFNAIRSAVVSRELQERLEESLSGQIAFDKSVFLLRMSCYVRSDVITYCGTNGIN